MSKNYIYIIITFLAMHLSAFIGVRLVYLIGITLFHVDDVEMKVWATGFWVVFSFVVGLLLVLLILRKSEPFTKIEKAEPMPWNQAILWAVIGIFIAFFAQFAAILVETALGIQKGSENTQQIMKLIELFPMVVLASSIIGPILEELVFRKVIFGALYNRFPFWVSALLSSLAFSLAHMEPEHLILYAAMGFTFAFLYIKTKRIIVPIISHMMMNTLVTVATFSTPHLSANLLIPVENLIKGVLG